MSVSVHLIPCLSDNYAALILAGDTTIVADAPQAAPIIAALDTLGRSLTHVLVTHHHHDHIDGLGALKQRYGATIIANAADRHRIAPVDQWTRPGETLRVGALSLAVIDTPGHTIGHVAYHEAAQKLLFAGDTLFAGGCGRIFEGTPAGMWAALKRLSALPDATRLYCGHEYTLSNMRFAASILPGDAAIAARLKHVEALRERGEPTVPSTLAEEKRANIFLRAGEEGVKAALGLTGADDAACFAVLRERKNKA